MKSVRPLADALAMLDEVRSWRPDDPAWQAAADAERARLIRFHANRATTDFARPMREAAAAMRSLGEQVANGVMDGIHDKGREV